MSDFLMSHLLYVLDENGQPKREPSVLAWGRWLESHESAKRVGWDMIGKTKVSTVFLGVDHAFWPGTGPVLWETMVFGGPLGQTQERCGGGREQAEAMHAAMVKRVRAAQKRKR